jgi:hypothetical protein
VIINGRSRRCVWWWSRHLQDTQENESVRVVKIEGLASENIYDLLREIEAQGLGTKAQNPMWIAVLNPGPNERLTDEQRDRARDILEQERGLTGQPYFLVEHEKNGWKHWHVVYSRIDTERMRALPDSLDAKVCHGAARKIEIELGLEKVIGPYDREPGTPRPPRAPAPWEMYRGMQTKIDPRDIAAEVTELYHQSRNGTEFQAALEQHGYQLATGRRGLLILDSAGKEHSLVKRIDGVKTAELNAFMREVDRATLPTVEQAKEQYQQRKIEGLEADRATVRHEIEWEEALAKAAIEKEKERQSVPPNTREKEGKRAGGEQAKPDGREEKEQDRAEGRPLDETRASIRLAYSLSQSPDAFIRNLDETGFKLARATKDEADRSHRYAAFAAEIGRYAPEYREGEYVAINQRGQGYSLNRRTTGDSRDEIAAFMRTADHAKIHGIDATRQEIAEHKRPAPAREMFPEPASLTGGIPMPAHTEPLNTWQQFGRAAREETRRDCAPNDMHGPSADIWAAYKRSDNARAFVAALHERDISLAVVTREDVTNSQIDRHYAADLNTPRLAVPPKLREGDYVAVADNGQILNLNVRTTGETADRVQKFMATLDRKEFQSVSAVLKTVEERGALRDIERQAFRDLSAGKLKGPKDVRPTGRQGRIIGGAVKDGIRASKDGIDKSARVTANILGGVGKGVDVIADAFASLFAPVLTPEQKREGEITQHRRDAEAEMSLDNSRTTAETTQQRRQQENDREAERQRERDGGGRDR